jgi:hypothetical protein
MVEWSTVRRLGIKQLRQFFSFTDGPLLCVRPEETHDIHALQSNTPAILLTDEFTAAPKQRLVDLIDGLRAWVHERDQRHISDAHALQVLKKAYPGLLLVDRGDRWQAVARTSRRIAAGPVVAAVTSSRRICCLASRGARCAVAVSACWIAANTAA